MVNRYCSGNCKVSLFTSRDLFFPTAHWPRSLLGSIYPGDFRDKGVIQEHSLATNDPFCYVSRTNFDAENERIDAHHDRIVLKRFPKKGLKRYLDSKKNRRLDALSQAIETEDDEAGISLYFVASTMAYMLTCLRPESSWKQRFLSFVISDENAYARSLLETFNNTLWTTYRLWQ